MLSLLDKCDKEGVFVDYQPLPGERNQHGLYFRTECGTPCIILDTNLQNQPRLARCVLAEEFGHHMTTVASNVFHDRYNFDVAIQISKTEDQAMRWATGELMPTLDVVRAITEGHHTPHDLAEHFYVTVGFVYRKMHFLRQDLHRSQGLRVKVRQILLPFLTENLWGLDDIPILRMDKPNSGFVKAADQAALII